MSTTLNTHVKLVLTAWSALGLESLEVMRGQASLDGGSPTFEIIVLLHFTSMEAMQACLAAAGEAVMGDIPNFTNIQPILQINEAPLRY